jgi:predicted permease
VNFLQILGIVTPVFLLVALGGLLRRIRWMSPEADGTLLKLGANVLMPALIADSVLGNSLLASASELWLPPVLGFLLVAASMAVVALLLKPCRVPQATSGAGILSAGVQNFGYMVVPLAEVFYQKETLGVLFLHNLGVEVAMWCLGIWVLTRQAGGSFWRRVINAPTLAILCSGALNLLHANEWLPGFVRKSLHMLGQAAIPVALLLAGVTLYDQLRLTHEERPRYGALSLAVAARILVLPLLYFATARWLPMPEALRSVLILQGAMPSAMMPIVICRLHNADSRFSIQIILLTTLISLVTIPLWIRFGLSFIGR